MATKKEVKDPQEIMQEIRDRLAEKTKSKSFAVTSQIGKAHMMDITNRDGLDYTVGGMFKGRWFVNTDGRIQQARSRGYYFPDEVDAAFKRLYLGNMVLMLQTAEASRDYTEKVENKTRSLENSQMANHQKAGRHFDDFSQQSVIRPV